MRRLGTALAHLALLLQDTVERADRGEIDPFVEHRGVDFVRALIAEALGMQNIKHRLALCRRERGRWWSPRP